MQFKTLKITQWQQFDSIELHIHERITILTGANGSGKTTLLNLFAKHFGWQSVSLSTPKQDKETGIVSFSSRLFRGEDKSSEQIIGEIEYSNEIKTHLVIQGSGAAAQYQIAIQNQQPVKCFFILKWTPKSGQ